MRGKQLIVMVVGYVLITYTSVVSVKTPESQPKLSCSDFLHCVSSVARWEIFFVKLGGGHALDLVS